MSEDQDQRAAQIIAEAVEAALDRKSFFPPRIMSVYEAEHYTKVSRTNLYIDVNTGLLRKSSLGGKTVFRREDLDEYLDNKIVFGKKRDTKAANAGLARARAEKKAAAQSAEHQNGAPMNGAADSPTA